MVVEVSTCENEFSGRRLRQARVYPISWAEVAGLVYLSDGITDPVSLNAARRY